MSAEIQEIRTHTILFKNIVKKLFSSNSGLLLSKLNYFFLPVVLFLPLFIYSQAVQ
ncbi:hypothetical protein L873DRAFT_1798523 [Choiromyces venosus 120613-1]|uniref:Uncharacterized protein n=1 Tax=Choiromyces venosus 120613-1 TaxID=1336337 RepID=A0A3N4K2D8_9PEZI|nr:hypothetical protein L873DRAFT_1798523 [Choiromyces venosus 120613-1]